MSKTELNKYLDDLLQCTFDSYYKKHKCDFENLKKNKIGDKDFRILLPKEYNSLIKTNYDIKQLKKLASEYKLKITGNKSVLIARIFSYLYLSIKILKIQKICKKYLLKKYIYYHGPAYINRTKCINTSDFFTMDELKDIPPSQFFSFEDDNKFIYGFDIMSFHNLIKKSGSNIVLNPFNKMIISSTIICRFNRLKSLSRLLNIPINLNIDEPDIQNVINISLSQTKAISLFNQIDQYGHYTNANWFMNLTREQLYNYSLELHELWNYRMNLSTSVKNRICHPTGNPFLIENLGNNQTFITHLVELNSTEEMRILILNIIDKMINNGINLESKELGCYIVLGALTLVSEEASISMPYLYESFSH